MDRKARISTRIQKLQDVLAEKELQAAMIYDRENLTYFTGLPDLEGAALAVPARGEPELFCIWMEAEYIRSAGCVDKVTPYRFPQFNQSMMMASWLKERNWTAPKLGFTRYFISLKDFQCLRDAVPDLFVGDIAADCYRIRSVKDEEEIALMQQASGALAKGMEAAFSNARPGMTETELLAAAEYAMRKAGSEGSTFRMQVLTHSRQMQKHPYASNAQLEDNAPVVVHLGASAGGYAAKMCRTVFLGEPDPESVLIYEVLRKAQGAAVQCLKPGVTSGQVYDAAAAVVSESGFGRWWVMDHIGYGVGIRQSEFYPVLAKDTPTLIEEDMVVDLLLPSIYKPGVGGPRLTDTIRVTKDGAEYLTQFSRDVTVKKTAAMKY